MKTKSGYETNGDYIKFKSGFTSTWAVETENEIQHFKTEDEADSHIVTKIIGCENAYSICKHFKVQSEGCNNRTKPIHLSEKWLNDFGFKKEVLSDDSAYYYTLELNDNKYCDLSISSGDKNEFIEVTLFPYEEWFRYKYVHELQNLFFAITGRELELKTDV